MRFDFAIIPHHKQRYETVGDWFKSKAGWCFRVSKMKDKRYCWLVFLHEFIEWAVCLLTGVTPKDVNRFDVAYEKARTASKNPSALAKAIDRQLGLSGCATCGCKLQYEPGDDIHAPYHQAHVVATDCERLIAKALNIDWIDYEESIDAL